MTDHLLGRTVIATNDRGARFKGQCVSIDLWGQPVVAVAEVDLGYAWGFETLPHTEEMAFRAQQVKRVAREGTVNASRVTKCEHAKSDDWEASDG